jgi:hypothetical protein
MIVSQIVEAHKEIQLFCVPKTINLAGYLLNMVNSFRLPFHHSGLVKPNTYI